MTSILRNCEFCDKPFLVERAKANEGYGKFCSRECYHLSTRKKVVKTCKFCGRSFHVAPSQAKRGYGKFCSRECFYAHKTACAYTQRVCETCGETFQILHSQIGKGGGIYCSRLCKDKAQEKDHIARQCKYCDRRFTVYPYVEKDDTRGQFCSNRCRYLWLSAHLHGENSHLWNGGTSEQEYGPGWSGTLKAIVRERDGYKCAVCRLVGKTIHHIDYSKDNHDLGNLVTLCPKCHGKTNHNRPYWEGVLSGLTQRRHVDV